MKVQWTYWLNGYNASHEPFFLSLQSQTVSAEARVGSDNPEDGRLNMPSGLGIGIEDIVFLWLRLEADL